MSGGCPIEIRGLRKIYGSFVAVDDLNLNIEKNSFTGFLGPNGAGKSTTLKVLTNLTRATEGNVYINGKGRRYRQNWQARRHVPEAVDQRFLERVQQAVYEIVRYAQRPVRSYTLMRGDCREAISRAAPCQLAVFSPPYPNSFDYTDVYNVELWALGYLADASSNRSLRQSTLASHVQVQRHFEPRPAGSAKLDAVSAELHESRQKLWSPHIPNMVDGYFADMRNVMQALAQRLVSHGEVWTVVGDSLYANIYIPVADILAELAPTCGFEVVRSEAFRSMRSSAQQGGRAELAESLVVFRKVN